jgi:tetratricopeptide (TPR) repeat protein
MIRGFILAIVFASMAAVGYAQHTHGSDPGARPVILMSGLGELRHPVSTGNSEAQRFFDQGLALIYAFNHDEAVRSFQRAAELDPQLAMAYWGIGLALGPNINLDVDPVREKAAYEAVQRARSMKAPESERGYIEALARRYSIDPKADLKRLSVDYKNAMGELVRRYPDDLDAATLYAESGMDLRPWKLWTKDGMPAEGTEEIVTVLESVLQRNPDHIGANHYYIHAVEASPHPERALASADRLQRIVKTAGHLVHMPSHVYMRVGDYDAAVRSNEAAAAVDRAYLESSGARGVYAAGYYSHNLHFLSIACSTEGKFREAKQAAEQLAANVTPFVKEIPPFESFLPTRTLVLVRFRRWEETLEVPEPDHSLVLTNAVWHWARAMAFAGTGRLENAGAERKLFVDLEKRITAEATWGLNSASNILKIAEEVLDAKISLAEHRDSEPAIELLKKAGEAEDALAYDEPPAWFLPVRETLGGTLMLSRRYEEAERVFRADLERHPRSGRSLFGLAESLKAQRKDYAARIVQAEFETAWRNADVKLNLEEL